MTGSVCQVCGSLPEISEKELKQRQGELEKIELENLKKRIMEQRKKTTSYELLVELGKQAGYKNPHFWAKKVLEGRKKKYASKSS